MDKSLQGCKAAKAYHHSISVCPSTSLIAFLAHNQPIPRCKRLVLNQQGGGGNNTWNNQKQCEGNSSAAVRCAPPPHLFLHRRKMSPDVMEHPVQLPYGVHCTWPNGIWSSQVWGGGSTWGPGHPAHLPYVYTVYGPNGLWSQSVRWVRSRPVFVWTTKWPTPNQPPGALPTNGYYKCNKHNQVCTLQFLFPSFALTGEAVRKRSLCKSWRKQIADRVHLGRNCYQITEMSFVPAWNDNSVEG